MNNNPIVALALESSRRRAALGGAIEKAHVYRTPFPKSGELHTGPIRALVPGRTDHIPMKVFADSYVLPADIVSALGEGNTEAGHQIIAGMFQPSEESRVRGGTANAGKPVDIIAAGGEYVLSPDQVAALGDGDVKAGHEVLDELVLLLRKNHINTLKKLPGPVKDT